MAQLVLLSKAPAQRPVQLALALLRGTDLRMAAVTRRNRGVLPQLENHAIIEAELTLRAGEDVSPARRVPEALADILRAVDETNRLVARAAAGDRGALREAIETDPAWTAWTGSTSRTWQTSSSNCTGTCCPACEQPSHKTQNTRSRVSPPPGRTLKCWTPATAKSWSAGAT